MTPPNRPRRGAALLLAMVILTLVSTLAAGMVWQQQRAVQVEAAERLRAQGTWLLSGMLDFGRLILRLDARTAGADHLGEPWAMKLEEASLAGLLAQDGNSSVEGAPEAYVTGSIRDAQSRYNLRNLVDGNFNIVEAELQTLQRLCQAAAVASGTAQTIASGLRSAWQPAGGDTQPADGGAALPPRQIGELVWLGVDADTVKRLQPYVSLLPVATPLNLNTASREVLAAVIPGLDASSAERIVQQVQRQHFKTLEEARPYITGDAALDPKRLGVASNYFEVSGRLRLEGRALEETQLVVRRSREVVALWRTRQVLQPAAR